MPYDGTRSCSALLAGSIWANCLADVSSQAFKSAPLIFTACRLLLLYKYKSPGLRTCKPIGAPGVAPAATSVKSEGPLRPALNGALQEITGMFL
ncbi:hypothetical protein D3C81_1127760 [compost metagenome]